MKRIFKIVLVTIIVVGLMLGAYFIFFHRDSNLSVYHSANNMIEYRHNYQFDSSLGGLVDLGYGENYANAFDDIEHRDLIIIREKLFVVDSADKLEGGTAESGLFYYYGYAKYEEAIFEGIKYYSTYTSLAGNAKFLAAKGHERQIEIYQGYFSQLTSMSRDIMNKQATLGIEGGITYPELLQDYINLRNSYRNALKSGAELLINLRDYVIEYAYNNNYEFSTSNVLYDSLASTIITATKADINQEINYLYDASEYIDKLHTYYSTSSISYGTVDEMQYLNAYKLMYFRDREDFDKIYTFTHFQKQDLITGNNIISAQIKIDFLSYARIVVDLLELR